MSSVCVSGCFASTGGSFLPPLGALAPLALVVRSEGVSYLTSDDSGDPPGAICCGCSGSTKRNEQLCFLLRPTRLCCRLCLVEQLCLSGYVVLSRKSSDKSAAVAGQSYQSPSPYPLSQR